MGLVLVVVALVAVRGSGEWGCASRTKKINLCFMRSPIFEGLLKQESIRKSQENIQS